MMSNICADIETSQIPYLDGELEDGDLQEFETHITDCDDCQHRLETVMQSHTELRAILQATPPASDLLMKRVSLALDAEDQQKRHAQRQNWMRWSMPFGASALAVAALALFVWSDLAASEEGQVAKSSQVTQDAARQHFQESPLFVSEDRSSIGRGAAGYLRTPVSAPRFATQNVRFLGWTPSQLGGKQSVAFVYEVVNRTGRHEVRVNAAALDSLQLQSAEMKSANGFEYWTDTAYGFQTVTVKRGETIAYVFSSDLSLSSLLGLVTNTDIVNSLERSQKTKP